MDTFKVKIIAGFKACPICGNTELSLTSEEVYEEINVDGNTAIAISCEQCSTKTFEYTIKHPEEYRSYPDMVNFLKEKWNRRLRIEDIANKIEDNMSKVYMDYYNGDL